MNNKGVKIRSWFNNNSESISLKLHLSGDYECSELKNIPNCCVKLAAFFILITNHIECEEKCTKRKAHCALELYNFDNKCHLDCENENIKKVLPLSAFLDCGPSTMKINIL